VGSRLLNFVSAPVDRGAGVGDVAGVGRPGGRGWNLTRPVGTKAI